MYRRALLIIMAIAISCSALFGMFSGTASAADKVAFSNDIYHAAERAANRLTLGICLQALATDAHNAPFSGDDIVDGKWFNSQSTDNAAADQIVFRWYDYTKGGPNDGKKCSEVDLPGILQNLGWPKDEFLQAACDLGATRVDKTDCMTGKDDKFEWNFDKYSQNLTSDQQFLDLIDKKYTGALAGQGRNYTQPEYYVMATNVLTRQCNLDLLPISATNKARANGKQLAVVDKDGGTQTYYAKIDDTNQLWAFRNAMPGESKEYDGSVNYTCSQLLDVANGAASAYAAYMKSTSAAGTCQSYANKIVTIQKDQGLNGKLVDACNAGMKNANDSTYCVKNYPAPDSASTSQAAQLNAACSYGQTNATNKSTTSTTDDGDGNGNTDNGCASNTKGLGWLVCPAMEFMASINDLAYGFLATNFLSVNTKTITDNQTKDAWAKFRDVANVLFIVALLFIVYSQITSFGLNNYGIKRMLPRLVVAALLVNISYFVCELMVDLSNVLGWAVANFFNGLAPTGGASNTATPGSEVLTDLGWVAVIGTAIGAGITLAFAISVPVLIAALLAIGLVVLILVIRQALIVLLVVISPVAFVAYLLPNTEQWFKKWYKMFYTLLLLFPVIGVIYGASRLAGSIIFHTNPNDKIMQLVALGVTAVPFFVVPGLLKSSLTATGALGTKLQGMANKATGKVSSGAKGTFNTRAKNSRIGAGLSTMKQYRDNQRAIRQAKRRGNNVVGNAFGRVIGGEGYNEKQRIRGESIENKEYEDDVKAAMDNQARHTSFDEKKAIAYGQREGVSDVERDAAIRFIGNNGNFNERRELLESMGTMDKSLRRSAISAARSKGDTGMYGSPTLGWLEDTDNIGGPEEIKAKLQEGFAKKIEEGGITAEMFHADPHRASYMTEQLVGKLNKTGDEIVDPTPQNQYITDKGREKMAESLVAFANSDKAQGLAAVTTVKASMVAKKSNMTIPNLPQGGHLPNDGSDRSQEVNTATTPQSSVRSGISTPPVVQQRELTSNQQSLNSATADERDPTQLNVHTPTPVTPPVDINPPTQNNDNTPPSPPSNT